MRRVLGGLLKTSGVLLLVSLLCVSLAVGLAVWSVSSPKGSGALLSLVPGLKVVDPQGSLRGDFQARRLEWHGTGGQTITVLEPHWRGLNLAWSDSALWHVQCQADSLAARRVDVQWPAKPGAARAVAPKSLALPLDLKIKAMQIGRIESNLLGAQPVLDFKGALALQQPMVQGAGREHTVKVEGLSWQGWQLQGQIRAAVSSPMALVGQVQAVSKLDRLNVSIQGPLVRPALAVQVQVLSRDGKVKLEAAAQSLSAQLDLQPFEPWPVLRAQVSARQFDLQRLIAAWPATGLSGEVVVQPLQALPGSPGAAMSALAGARREPAAQVNADLRVRINLQNDRPGLWDAGLVPVKRVQADVTLPAQASMGHLADVGREGSGQAQLTLLARAGRAASSLALEGHWSLSQRQQTRLNAQVAGLDLTALHSRAPALWLKGQVVVQGQADQSWLISGALNGTDAGAKALAVPVAAQWVAHWLPGQLQIDQWSLNAGAAKAQGKARWVAAPAVGGEQTVSAQASLLAFDPAVWMPWPRPAGDAIERTRLDGELSADLKSSTSGLGWVGKAQGTLKSSLLLGVPVDAQWDMNAPAAVLQAKLNMKAAGNQAQLDVTWPLPKPGEAAATWSLAGAQANAVFEGASLAALQPWAQALGLQGLTGQLKLNGQWASTAGAAPSRWGVWRSQGQLSADGVQWDQGGGGRVALQGAHLQWALASDLAGAGALPWAIKGDVARAQWGTWVVQQALVSLDGPGRHQKISVQGRVDLPDRKLPGGGVIKESVKAQLLAQGAWQSGAGALSWQGKVQSLSVVPLTVVPVAPWLDVQPFEVRWSQDAAGLQWLGSPTRALVFGAALAVRKWQWQAPAAGAGQVDLEVDLEPLKLAEVLARLQPKVGWGGDLTINGKLKATAKGGQGWLVDAQVLRQAGDLSLIETGIDGANVQRLGVRQIKVDLKARDGVWTFSELLDGRVMGQFQGQQVVQAASASALPGPKDALSGQFSAKVDNLRALGVWAPAGWRLSGQMAAQATLSGQLGDPHYTGQVSGQKLGLGHALSGVQMSEGDLLLNLQGDQARLDHFTAKGGGESGGRLSVSGEALLGAEPTATLSVKADHFGLFQRVDRQAVVTGEVQLNLGPESIKADGRVTVDEGLVDLTYADAPTVGDDVVVTNRPDADPEEEAVASNARKRKLSINLALDLGRKLRLRGRGLDTHLGGTLRMSTPAGRAQVQGTVVTRDGTYAAYGQKLLIERGSLAFTGPIENPRLDILAMRAQSATASSSDVKVGVVISGTALDPRVRLYSEPAMSETEKLSWLVLGRGSVGLGGADIGLLQTAASALWAGEGGSPKDTVVSAIGLDELSIRQTDGAVRNTIVSVGKQVSSRWYLGYERSLNATTGSWQAIYRLAQRFTLRAQTGDDNALDFIWSWRWD